MANLLTQYNNVKEILAEKQAKFNEATASFNSSEATDKEVSDHLALAHEIEALKNQLFYAKLQIAAIALAVVGGSAAGYMFAPQIAAGTSAAYLAAKPHLVAFGMAVYAGLAKIAAAGNAHLVQPFLAYAQALGAKLFATVGVDSVAHATAATVTGATTIAAGVTGGVYAGYKAAKAVVNFAEDAAIACAFSVGIRNFHM